MIKYVNHIQNEMIEIVNYIKNDKILRKRLKKE